MYNCIFINRVFNNFVSNIFIFNKYINIYNYIYFVVILVEAATWLRDGWLDYKLLADFKSQTQAWMNTTSV